MEIIIGIAIYLILGILLEVAIILLSDNFEYDPGVFIDILIWPLILSGCIAMSIANFIHDIITKCKGEK